MNVIRSVWGRDSSKPGPARTRAGIFYGWRVVALSVLAGFMVYGVGLYSFTLFVEPLALEFDWDRARLGGAISAFWIAAPLTLFIGPLVDRFGVKRLVIVGVVLEGTALALLSLLHLIWPLYLLRILMGAGKVLVAASLPVLLSQWFAVRYGMALAIALTGFHLGGLVMVPVTQTLINHLGWRTTTVLLGMSMILVTLPCVLWILRVRSPAALGLRRDGAEAGIEADLSSTSLDPGIGGRDYTLAEAAKTPGFWLLVNGTLLFYFSYSSVLAHAATFFHQAGMSVQEAARTVGWTAGAAVLGVLVSGMLVSYYPVRRLLPLLFAALLCALALLLTMTIRHEMILRYTFIAVFGFAIGAIDVVAVSFLRATFGALQYAHIFGAWYFASLAGLLLGPVVAGAIYDKTGSYQSAFIAAAVAAFLGGALILPLQRPGRRPARAAG